jgi:FKBP-type peptidyl-prolyl cis-trans isomerase (trigger factor)
MRRLFLVPLVVSLTLLAAACGGGSSNDNSGGTASGDDAAVVNGEHITQATLDRRLSEAACSYKLQKKTFPNPGTTEYQQIRSQILQSLVQRAQLAQKAPGLDVKVTDKQVEAQLKKLKTQYFGGSESKYRAELKRQCVNDAEVRDDLRSNLLSNAVFAKVTTDAKVTPAEVKTYYDGHRQVYTTP